ncbi:MAG: carboxypeptidase regulatory-like domain-containing protein [Gammaproteobacteria bacterium]|nr:carboxypeptidase regulatory-like domain-containing protein [Gammaproteobacteria bacterium]NNK32812.1 outer membrane beta-barrel protein [Xanthomonadales bacterium]
MPVACRRLAGLLLGALFATGAWAQTSELTLYVFNKGAPVPNIEVLLDDELLTLTDDRGVAALSMTPGIHYLELRIEDFVVLDQQILAIEDEISQWIVDISAGGSAFFDVESSGPGETVAPQAEAAVAADLAPGRLSGRLTSADGGEAIAGARVFVSGLGSDIRSDDSGAFTVEVPPGTYSVSILHSGFNTLTRDGVAVEENADVAIDLVLTPAGSELPEYVVVVPHISGSLASVLEERREVAAVANILGAEQIAKAGDSDAAGALKRVTGLTLVGGRFIFVRGMGERYSSTLLNGANVPSPDPTRRVVPLDLFPAGIIDSIAVQKSFTPEMPAEFGGGTVQLRTKNIPEDRFFEVEAKIGYNSQTTGKDGLRYQGGGRDWTGYDDGTRAPSDELAAATANGTPLTEFNPFTGEGYTKEELEMIGESLPLIYDVQPEKIDPNLGFGLAGGNRYEFSNGVTLGVMGAMDYDDKWYTTVQRRIQYVVGGEDELVSNKDFTYLTNLRNIDLSGFFTVGAEIGDHHQVAYNWMLLRNTTDRTQRWQGTDKDAEGGDVQFTELWWFERQLMVNQFLGRHEFPALKGLSVNWDYTLAKAESEEPDLRTYRYDPDTLTDSEDDLIFSLRNDNNQRRWGQLEDDSDSWNLGLVQPVSFSDRTDLSLRGGLSSVEKARDFGIRRFNFRSRGPLSRDLETRRNLNPEDVIYDETIDPRGWQLREITVATDTYVADQTIDSWYLGLDLEHNDWLRLGGGVRQEKSDQSVSTFNAFDPENNPVTSDLETDDLFWSFSGTLVFGDHQIRAGYGETTNRPDFKELSPAVYEDPLLDRFVKGNPNLIPAYLTNYDLRWDWFFDQGEFVSLGGFYKDFSDPIETVILAGAEQATSFDNAEAAENLGIEFELFINLDFIGRWWGEEDWWAKWYINTNYAWIDSEITLSERNASVQTSQTRPLQGQSPYVWNFQLGYDDLDRGINTALLFNMFGERIVDVGINGAPDVYQEPRPVLDFVYAQKFRDHWKLKLRARNLLNAEVEITQGDKTRRKFTVGREYQLALEWSW